MAGVQIAHANRTFFSFSECYISASNIGSVSDEVASPAIRTVRSNSDFYRMMSNATSLAAGNKLAVILY